MFYRWGSEKKNNLSKGIGGGRVQDLKPGLLTPEHGLSASC